MTSFPQLPMYNTAPQYSSMPTPSYDPYGMQQQYQPTSYFVPQGGIDPNFGYSAGPSFPYGYPTNQYGQAMSDPYGVFNPTSNAFGDPFTTAYNSTGAPYADPYASAYSDPYTSYMADPYASSYPTNIYEAPQDYNSYASYMSPPNMMPSTDMYYNLSMPPQYGDYQQCNTCNTCDNNSGDSNNSTMMLLLVVVALLVKDKNGGGSDCQPVSPCDYNSNDYQTYGSDSGYDDYSGYGDYGSSEYDTGSGFDLSSLMSMMLGGGGFDGGFGGESFGTSDSSGLGSLFGNMLGGLGSFGGFDQGFGGLDSQGFGDLGFGDIGTNNFDFEDEGIPFNF